MLIKDHRELANHIKESSVLALNSFGKDAALTIEWLATFAKPKKIVALHFEFISKHPSDEAYLNWQKKRYPNVEFISVPNPHELQNIAVGIYQDPIRMMTDYNYFEHDGFSMEDYAREIKKNLGLDYICTGHARYECMARATSFHKKGILQGDRIFPLGMMSKKEVINLIKVAKIKLHPCYKFAQSTYDMPSYYKMRNAFIANPEYRKNVLKAFPMIELDEYRYRVLFKS